MSPSSKGLPSLFLPIINLYFPSSTTHTTLRSIFSHLICCNHSCCEFSGNLSMSKIVSAEALRRSLSEEVATPPEKPRTPGEAAASSPRRLAGGQPVQPQGPGASARGVVASPEVATAPAAQPAPARATNPAVPKVRFWSFLNTNLCLKYIKPSLGFPFRISCAMETGNLDMRLKVGLLCVVHRMTSLQSC